MSLKIHESSVEKLEYYISINKIPNIIFHGVSGCGKRTIVNNFITSIYKNDKEKIKNFVMNVNCAHGKGIKFIRDELKFFAKTHIHSNGGNVFKCILLMNADKLTIDAQSALRRCIELFSHNTRFFIIVEDKYKLLKPILSRFCEIYIPEVIHNGNVINLYRHNLDEVFKMKEVNIQRIDWLKKELNKIEIQLKKGEKNVDTGINLSNYSIKLYEKGYSGLDIIQLLENISLFTKITMEKRYELLFTFNKVRKEFRNEKILIMFILNFLFLDTTISIQNISF